MIIAITQQIDEKEEQFSIKIHYTHKNILKKGSKQLKKEVETVSAGKKDKHIGNVVHFERKVLRNTSIIRLCSLIHLKTKMPSQNIFFADEIQFNHPLPSNHIQKQSFLFF